MGYECFKWNEKNDNAYNRAPHAGTGTTRKESAIFRPHRRYNDNNVFQLEYFQRFFLLYIS